MFPFAVALTSYGSVAIRYVLPVCSRRQKTVENVEEEDVCASDMSSRFLALYKFVCMYMCHKVSKLVAFYFAHNGQEEAIRKLLDVE